MAEAVDRSELLQAEAMLEARLAELEAELGGDSGVQNPQHKQLATVAVRGSQPGAVSMGSTAWLDCVDNDDNGLLDYLLHPLPVTAFMANDGGRGGRGALEISKADLLRFVLECDDHVRGSGPKLAARLTAMAAQTSKPPPLWSVIEAGRRNAATHAADTAASANGAGGGRRGRGGDESNQNITTGRWRPASSPASRDHFHSHRQGMEHYQPTDHYRSQKQQQQQQQQQVTTKPLAIYIVCLRIHCQLDTDQLYYCLLFTVYCSIISERRRRLIGGVG